VRHDKDRASPWCGVAMATLPSRLPTGQAFKIRDASGNVIEFTDHPGKPELVAGRPPLDRPEID